MLPSARSKCSQLLGEMFPGLGNAPICGPTHQAGSTRYVVGLDTGESVFRKTYSFFCNKKVNKLLHSTMRCFPRPQLKYTLLCHNAGLHRHCTHCHFRPIGSEITSSAPKCWLNILYRKSLGQFSDWESPSLFSFSLKSPAQRPCSTWGHCGP